MFDKFKKRKDRKINDAGRATTETKDSTEKDAAREFYRQRAVLALETLSRDDLRDLAKTALEKLVNG